MQTHELWPLLLAGLAGLALGVFFFGGLWWTLKKSLGACAAEGVESENRPQRGQFLPDVQPHSPAMGQIDGETWTAAGDLQPTPLLPRRLLASPRPALWFLGSLLLRTGVALTGFYLVGGGHWQRLLACLVGFVLARLLVTRLTRASTTGAAVAAPAARQKQEVDHAPQP